MIGRSAGWKLKVAQLVWPDPSNFRAVDRGGLPGFDSAMEEM
jgi:hypothetical protein